MSEAKFTPGPWHLEAGFESSPGDFEEYWQVHDGQDAIVCSSSFCTAENKEANARLIAAAPELYEALNGLLRTLAESGIELDSLSSPTPLINLLNTEEEYAVLEQSRAALAKARGEAP
ncbi:hypothetical protein [Acetobacter ghanensis]|uniref:Uncharacterized protein n=1 Tax=Acetobacter ghanensis TaxID=431306 RepID=A0A0U5F7K3_9PROT|nr:hypothetical protein [Acetobacter ghanensis]NHO39442.1 hypothetical protein [Acetobacter ghanensis]GBQ46503.1 hypothetical protein AA18895_0784 [Acetobacter ghanensis DSM 18895]CEF54582.1 hypothetical protein predicted by Glimmer/Critica [Acetobacter ghanensis]